jgi:hypothetical protein
MGLGRFGDRAERAAAADYRAGVISEPRPGRLLRLGLPRDPQAVPHLVALTISAVATILLTRGLLAATGYPQLGGGGLHVAHVLWGGLLMLAAHVLLLSFVGPSARPMAAIVGGAGFGLFIDEVGKFVTSDNDYFYRPALAIMYVVLVLLMVGVHALHGRRPYHPAEHLAGAIDYAVSGVAGGFTPAARARAEAQLLRAGGTVPGTVEAAALLAAIPADPYDLFNPVSRGAELLSAARRGLLDRRAAGVATVWAVIAQAVAALVVTAVLAYLGATAAGVPAEGEGWVSLAGMIVGSVVSTGFVVAGLRRLRVDRQSAFRRFQRGVMVSLLLTQVFQFAVNQLWACAAVAVDLGLFVAISAELHELRRRATADTGSVVPP